MTSEGLGEMFEGNSADTCADFFLTHVDGVPSEGQACADPGGRTDIDVSGNLFFFFLTTITKISPRVPKVTKILGFQSKEKFGDSPTTRTMLFLGR